MKKFFAFLLAAAMTMSFAACGGGNEPAPSTSTPSTTENKDTPAPAATEEKSTTDDSAAEPTSSSAPDQDLVIALNNDISSLDPQNASDTLSMTVNGTMYEALLKFDENQQIQPSLAESYEASEDGLTYTFHLRQGVKFHDGSDFNSAAFMANYQRCMDDTSLRYNRTVVKWESVECPDDYTVVIKLLTANSTFANKMTMFDMISAKAIEEKSKEELIKQPVGTGPYKFQERTEGDRVVVVPNPDYWGGAPAVNSLTFRAVPEDGSRVAMLQTGEADYIYPMPSIQAESVAGTKDIELVTSPSCIMRYVTLNTTVPELSDPKVRQAMNYAINKEAYIKTVFNGFASTVESCFPSTVQYYSAQAPYNFDLEKAKSLMAEAGYENGFDVTIWGDNTTTEQKGMQFVQQQLAQIGINVEVLPMESNTLNDMIYVEKDEAKIQMWYVNWSPSSFDADGAVRNILHSENAPPKSANTAYYSNPEFDKALDDALLTTDPTKMTELYGQAQKLVWDDAPWLFLGTDQLIAGKKSYVDGVHLAPDGSLDCSKATLA